jgi:diguanylate cyclase (GGDEF)-like protein/PAS domain S-box-containing protein
MRDVVAEPHTGPEGMWDVPFDVRLALDAAADGASITDAGLDRPGGPVMLYVNDALCALTGYSRGELIGRSPRILQGPATDRVTLDRLLADLRAGLTFAGQAVNYRKDGRAFVMEWTIAPVRRDGATVAFIAIQRDVTTFRARLADAEERARTDWLTGLANRGHLDAVLAVRHAIRPVDALLVDIDRFKRINDVYGHRVGDEVLREVAARLRGAMRGDDVVARFGGEEFCLLVETGGDLREIGERVRSAIAGDPVATSAGPLGVTVSVGGAVARRDPDELLSAADAALYRAKHGGRDRVVVA